MQLNVIYVSNGFILNLDNNQFDLTTKGIDYPDEVNNLTTKGIDYPNEVNIDNIFLSTTQLNMMQKINKAIEYSFNFNDDKVDLDTETEINPIDCKYYTINQFNDKHLNSTKHSSIIHLNTLKNSE